MTNVQQIEMFEDLIEKVQNVANAIPPANPVPDVTSADDGKVLKATYSGGEGSYDWEDESYPKPTYAGNGQVLTADGAGGASWQNPQGGGSDLPEITSSDIGKVLQANYDDKSGSGYTEWVTPSSGQSATLAKTDATYDDKSGVYFWQIPTIEYASVVAANIISLIEYSGYISELDGIKPISEFSVYEYNSGSGISIGVSSTVYNNITGGTLKFGIA